MMKRAFLCMILCAFFPGILLGNEASENEKTSKQQREVGSMQSTVQVDKAMFAGGCFWCMEKSFEQLEGVITVISGYSGGQTTQPTYQDYAQGGHIEVIEVTYDSRQVTYEALLELFWHQIDPTDEGGQFADRGHGYSTAIFYMNDTQQILAAQSKAKLSQSHVFTQPIVTVISAAQAFYAAEDYHQDYYKNNPVRYWYYRKGSGRDQFLNKVWGARKVNDLGSSSLQNRLTAMQYKVTQESGTEPAFHNAYWDNKAAGIYVDIVSGEPLFSSIDQFESGTGWPSFSRPLVAENIVEREDSSFFSVRTELRSKKANSHLGHVFTDGPKPTGLRYCLNSASLRFIPANALEEEGYKAFASLFEQALP